MVANVWLGLTVGALYGAAVGTELGLIGILGGLVSSASVTWTFAP